MNDCRSPTDQIKKIELPSSLQQVLWTKAMAAPGAKIGLNVFTHFVGNGSQLEIELSDQSGKTLGKFKDKIYGDHFWATVKIPDDAKDAFFARIKLPKHSLEKKSNPLLLLPSVKISNLKWDKKEARRGDVLKMTAEIKGVPDGTESEIEIWEYDTDGAHDLITKFSVFVTKSKVEQVWEFEYFDDTDDIPTEEESEAGYHPPEYFFRVKVAGVHEDSSLLEFKDWIELSLVDRENNPMPDEKYILFLPDGSQKNGTLDAQGKAKVEDIPPGPVIVEYPDVDSIEDVEETEEEES